MDIIHAACMDETYGTYVDDECFDIHGYDDDTVMILMLILMTIPMMVGAGTCILSLIAKH